MLTHFPLSRQTIVVNSSKWTQQDLFHLENYQSKTKLATLTTKKHNGEWKTLPNPNLKGEKMRKALHHTIQSSQTK